MKMDLRVWFKTTEQKDAGSSPVRAPKPQVAAEQPPTGGRRTLQKKRPTSKDREAAPTRRQQRHRHGAVTARACRGATHKLGAATPMQPSHSYAGSELHVRLPSLGVRQRHWESPGNLTLMASGTWLQDFHRTGETDSSPGEHREHRTHHAPKERSSDPPGGWSRPTCWCWRVSCDSLDRQWLTVEMGTPAAEVLEVPPLVGAHLGVTMSPTIEPIDSRAGMPQAKQLTGKEHSLAHQPTIELLS